MAASEQSDTLWNVSVVSNKSWVELVEDEEDSLARAEAESKTTVSQVLLTVKPGDKSLTEARQVAAIITEEESRDTVALDGPTYANILKSSDSPEHSKEAVPAPTKDFLHEDISLTGHIQGFQLTSPCKNFKTPTKSVDPPAPRCSPRNLKRRILEETTVTTLPDELLMPSPGKIARSSEKLSGVSPLHLNRISNEGSGKKGGNPRKRLRDRDLQTPPHRRFDRAPPELETNEEILARRQKQIDYGKNTVGYERYRQLVPKDCRKSVHPRTPPMHLKYSRRAWEGLVRIWRQRLHFWDPPSEGGGDPACLEGEVSDMSDVGSTDGSLPSTPVQDMKRRQVYMSPSDGISRAKHHRANRPSLVAPSADDDLDRDCQPLSPE